MVIRRPEQTAARLPVTFPARTHCSSHAASGRTQSRAWGGAIVLCCVSCLWFMSSFRHCAESGISGVPGPGIGDRKLRQFSPPDGVTESTVVFRVTFFGLEMGIGFGTGIEAEKGHSRASREPSWGPQTAKQTPGPELCRRNLNSLCGSAIFGQILGGSPSGPPQNAQKKNTTTWRFASF